MDMIADRVLATRELSREGRPPGRRYAAVKP
jgi:hypothetical protein